VTHEGPEELRAQLMKPAKNPKAPTCAELSPSTVLRVIDTNKSISAGEGYGEGGYDIQLTESTRG